MNPLETAELLEVLHEASLVNKPRPLTVKVWCRALADVRVEDVQLAADELMAQRTSDQRWVTPGDVRARVTEIRAARFRQAGVDDPLPRVDPDRVVSFQAWRLAHRKAVGDGLSVPEADQIAAQAAAGQIVGRPALALGSAQEKSR